MSATYSQIVMCKVTKTKNSWISVKCTWEHIIENEKFKMFTFLYQYPTLEHWLQEGRAYVLSPLPDKIHNAQLTSNCRYTMNNDA